MGIKAFNKMPRKVKRTIRKTVAGICLVSALVVALVPAEISTASVEPSISNSYAYGVESTDVSSFPDTGVNLSLFGTDGYKYDDDVSGTQNTDKVFKVLTVKQLSDGTYQVNWQFKIYLQQQSGTAMGVICQYNSTYQTGTVDINPTMPYKYCVVETDFYDAFYQLMAAKKAENENATTGNITANRLSGSSPAVSLKAVYHIDDIDVNDISDKTKDIYWIYRYFPVQYASYETNLAAYKTQETLYSTYLTDLEAYNNRKQTAETNNQVFTEVPPTSVAAPGTKPSLTVWVSDMLDEYKLKYFCKVHPDYETYLTAEDYTLTEVYDSRDGSTSVSAKKCYMPKGTPNQNGNDNLGFHVNDVAYVIAIGDKAFENTTNVNTLNLCSEIKYIGKEAFKNSFVKSVNFNNVENIGDRAFSGCSQLQNIVFDEGLKRIGVESFYGCGFNSLVFPYSIAEIGKGAFAECINLSNLDFSGITQANSEIEDFAFYNTIALSSLKFSDTITKLGAAAFACSKGVTSNLTSVKLPDHISQDGNIGNFLFAGRTNIQYVTMPADYGKGSQVTLPYGVFYNCVSLKNVDFPAEAGSCGYVKFGEYVNGDTKRTMFDTVQTKDFYVSGPEFNMSGGVASPRKSTWGLETGLGNPVPYVYVDVNGEEHYEVSNGEYILIIDNDGVLQSCSLVDDSISKIDNLIIPAYVGDTKVTGVATNCFDSEIKGKIEQLTIADDSITKIEPGAFKNCLSLKRVNIGNSVTSIGDSAFEGCKNLEYVDFAPPAGGYSSFPLSAIGDKAFSTGSNSLTFEGDVDLSYGPFVWAMQKDNYVDESKGLRVCYTTGYPYYQTIIVDNRNGYPTLVDYLHYDQLDDIDKELGLWDSSDPNSLTKRFENLGLEESDVSGNVNYTYTISLAEEKMINAALNLLVPSGVESVDVYGYMNNSSKLGDGYSNLNTNSYNVSTYLSKGPYYTTYKNTAGYTGGLFKGYYGTVNGTDGKREYPTDNSKEKLDIGNDRLQTVTLNSVKYLPDYCFYSCENLYSVSLGNEMDDIGVAPFTGCSALSGLGSASDKYVTYNGIVYSQNNDGTYNIVEVLSSRGDLVGSQKIRVSEEDPYFANVATISDGAFEDCDYITGVDFSGTLVTEIPDDCFKNCDKLNQVTLPEEVNAIGHNAFAGCMEGISLVVYGKEVYLPSDAFGTKTTIDDNDFVESKRVISYKDSAVRKAASDIGADVTETLDDTVTVQFMDYDGTELSRTIYVTVGESIKLTDIPADPVREGYTFKGWNKPLTNITTSQVIVATYTQNPTNSENGNGENGNNNNGNNGNSGNNGTTDNGNTNNNNGNTNTNTSTTLYTLTVTNGNGSGSYAAGATVIITCTNPPTGKVFDKWVPTTTDLGIASVSVAATTMVMPAHDASVTATFKDTPVNTNGTSNNSGGSGNANSSTSGGTTNSSNGTTNSGSSVVVSKPGVSNSSLASATVSGSNDNYVVRITETAAATAAVETALTNEYGSLDNIRYSAMDISLYDSTGSNKITNYSGLSVTITMPIPDTMTQYAGNNKVAAVSNEKLEKLNPKFTSIDGVPCITFTATHFSPYVIYTDTSNLTVGVSDTTPKTGDGIAPKWFLVFGLSALGIALLFIKDKKPVPKAVAA